MKTIKDIAKQTPEMAKVLRRMCRMVKAKASEIDFDDPDWYRQHTWSEATRDKFVQWLSREFYTNHKMRREMVRVSAKSKRVCQDAARFFDFMYGWVVKDSMYGWVVKEAK